MGSGFKDFAPGDILTAADVDGYLMRQTVMTFADASARDTALSGVLDEGMVAYLEDSDYFTVYDGSAWVVYGNTPAYELVKFTSSGTFTIATYPWAKSVRVRVVGGGGAGGGAAVTSATEVSCGGGGGGGGYSEKRIAVSALSSSETVTVGAGGTASTGANGGNGGNSSFGTHAVGNGGAGGQVGAAAEPRFMNGLPGAGGSASAGDFNLIGGAGQTAVGLNDIVGRVLSGAGGNSALGSGGTQIYTASSSPGDAGNNFGGGGSGAASDNSTAATQSGGAGGVGIVIVEIFG